MMASASRLRVGLEAGDRDADRVQELGEMHACLGGDALPAEKILHLSCGIKFHQSVFPFKCSLVFPPLCLAFFVAHSRYLDLDIAPKVLTYSAWSPAWLP